MGALKLVATLVGFFAVLFGLMMGLGVAQANPVDPTALLTVLAVLLIGVPAVLVYRKFARRR